MAATVYRLDGTISYGAQLSNILERMGADFAQLKTIRLRMIQATDGDGSEDTHFVEVAALWGYKDAALAADTGPVAHDSFAEIDSFIGTGGPSLEQCIARHVRV